MLTHLTPMIAALSLALTAGSFPEGWSRLSSMFDQRCTKSHAHAGHGAAQPDRKLVIKRHQLYEAQVLSFGP
jgi:hypothetical protein